MEASAWHRAQSDHGAATRWQTAHLDWFSADRRVDAHLVNAAAVVWTASPCTDLTIGPTPNGRRPALTIRVAATVPPDHGDDAGWTDLAVEPDTGIVRQATIALHPNRWSDLTERARTALLIHEMGHALGLAHTIQHDSMMFAGLQDRVALAEDDVAAVCAVFAVSPKPTAAPASAVWVIVLAPLMGALATMADGKVIKYH